MKDLVKDHLGKSACKQVSGDTDGMDGQVSLELDGLPALLDLFRNISHLNGGIWLNDAQEVLFQQCVVKSGKMSADGGIRGQL